MPMKADGLPVLLVLEHERSGDTQLAKEPGLQNSNLALCTAPQRMGKRHQESNGRVALCLVPSQHSCHKENEFCR